MHMDGPRTFAVAISEPETTGIMSNWDYSHTGFFGDGRAASLKLTQTVGWNPSALWINNDFITLLQTLFTAL
jgi:hypothetical protein